MADDFAKLLHEPHVTVRGKPGIAGHADKALPRSVVEADIKDSFHHSGHRYRRSRPDRDEEWSSGVAKLAPSPGPKSVQLALKHVRQSDQRFWATTQVVPANLSSNNETGWDWKSTCGHPHQVVGFGADNLFRWDLRRRALEWDLIDAEFQGFEHAVGRH